MPNKKRMLEPLFEPYLNQIAAFAQGWIAQGAKCYSLWVNAKCFQFWPNKAQSKMSPDIVAPIFLGHKKIAELRLTGLTSKTTNRQLRAEAQLLTNLLTRDRDLTSMTSLLVDTRDYLLAFYKLMQGPRDSLEIHTTLQNLNQEIAQLVGVEGSVIFVNLPAQQPLIVSFPTEIIKLSQLNKLIQELILSGEQYLTVSLNSMWSRHLKNIMLLPINIRQPGYAVLALINKLDGNFTLPDLKLTQAISEYTAAQIENVLLFQSLVEQTKIQTELDLAQRVQNQLIPRDPPNLRGFDVAVTSRPASSFGGDFYDFIIRSDQQFTFAVGDVSGKGMSAALLMAMARTAIRSSANTPERLTPEAVISNSNRDLYADFTEVNMFATVFIGQFQPDTQNLVYANAGHAPVIYCPVAGAARFLEADGTAMGIMQTTLSKDQQLQLQKGDVLVVGTDGFCEARDAQDKMFGYNEIMEVAQKVIARPAQEIADYLCETVDTFSNGRPREDDQTLVVLKLDEV